MFLVKIKRTNKEKTRTILFKSFLIEDNEVVELAEMVERHPDLEWAGTTLLGESVSPKSAIETMLAG